MSSRSLQNAQELKRVLSFADLVVYGVAFMIPVAPFAIFGYVYAASSGMVVLAYLVGMAAMLLTAFSYKFLSADFPLAGSVYAYATRGIGEVIGFVAGWMLMLDYLLVPALTYVAGATALHDFVPAVSRTIWVLVFLAIGTGTNYLGAQATSNMSRLFIIAQLIVLALFCVAGFNALYHGAGAGRLTLAPLFKPEAVDLRFVFSAVSICALSFLGFDAISTLAEEVRGDRKALVGRATITALVLAGAIFVVQTWIAADLAQGMTFTSADTAFYDVARRAGGQPLALLADCTTAIVFGVSCSIVSQTAIARLLFSMARDRKLPRFFADLHPRYGSPHKSLLFVAVVSLAIAIGFLDHLDTLAEFVNFGALTGFVILHATVVVHFFRRKRSHAFVRHLVVPVCGAAILLYVLYSMSAHTWLLGAIWLCIGVAYYGLLKSRNGVNARLDV